MAKSTGSVKNKKATEKEKKVLNGSSSKKKVASKASAVKSTQKKSSSKSKTEKKKTSLKQDKITYEKILDEMKESEKAPKKKEKKKVDKPIFTIGLLDLFIAIALTALVSCIGTGIILNLQYNKSNILTSKELKSDENLSEFIRIYSEVVDNFYEDVDKNKIIDAAIDGMISFLEDEYSIYLNDEETDSLEDTLDGSYDGIGVEIYGRSIVNVYDDSPAAKAGVKTGDLIIGINDTDITDGNIVEINNIMAESKDQSVTLKLQRGEQVVVCNVSFGKVYVPLVKTERFNYDNVNIGYIELSSFAKKAYDQFNSGLLALEDKGIDSLIIDLRDNSGGYLSTASDIMELFLGKDEVMYYLEKKDEKKVYKDKTSDKRSYPIVVIIDSKSASAAEIMTLALKDSYGCKVVGAKSFGKGTVQNTKQLSDGTMVKYTSAKWFGPNEESIDKVGIVPDYEVTYSPTEDAFLEKALKVLRDMHK